MKVFEAILDAIYPRKCAFCHKKMGKEEGLLCADCEKSLPYAGKDSGQRIPFTSRCWSPLFYEGDVRDSLHRFKFGGLNMYAAPYANLMHSRCAGALADVDLISWVPLSRARLRTRGYDQAHLLAAELAERAQLPCVKTLKKIKNVKPQSRTGAFESRQKNIRGAYTVTDAEAIKGKNILLVDDIITTGATISECAATLLEAGAKQITGMTVARRKD